MKKLLFTSLVLAFVMLTTNLFAGSGYISNGFCEARQMITENGGTVYNSLAVRGKFWYIVGYARADVSNEKYSLPVFGLRCSESFVGTQWDYDYDDAVYAFSNGYCWGHLSILDITTVITIGYTTGPPPTPLHFKVYLY